MVRTHTGWPEKNIVCLFVCLFVTLHMRDVSLGFKIHTAPCVHQGKNDTATAKAAAAAAIAVEAVAPVL